MRCGREGVVERDAESGAAGIAAAVRADEDDRAADEPPRVEVGSGQLVEAPELEPGHRAPRLLDGRAEERHAGAAVGTAHEHDLPVEGGERRPDRRRERACRRRRPSPTLPAPRRAATRPPRWRSPRAARRRRARRRRRSTLMPAAGRRAGARARGRSRARRRRPGSRRAPSPCRGPGGRRPGAGRSSGVCSSVDELDHLDVVADGAEQLRPGGVGHLGGEPLAQRPVAEERAERGVLELRQQLVLAARDREDHPRARRARRGRARRRWPCRRRAG